MKQITTYLRVSTQRQGASGLGLEAQRAAVQAYCAEHKAQVSREFREIESGKNDARPVLAKALAYAKKTKTLLVVAKLDRLGRKVSFLSRLLETDVKFYFCDQPGATRMVLHIMAAVAEGEAKAIGDRTRDALQAAKARGTKLGAANPKCRNLDAAARKRGVAAARKAVAAQAREAYDDVMPIIRSMREGGASFESVANALNAQGHATRRGKLWNASQVLRALKYAQPLAA